MRKDFMNTSKVSRRALIVVMVLASVVVGVGGEASLAVAKEPTGEYAAFKECPRFTVLACLYSQVVSGETRLNRLTVPITVPITFQFGADEENPAGTGILPLFPALGETLVATPEPIPGGLSGLIDCDRIGGKGFIVGAEHGLCEGLVRSRWGRTAYATLELAQPVSEIYQNIGLEHIERGVELRYAAKFHLENRLLGDKCYIGTNTDPIVFNFTTGTTSPPPPNQPISGTAGAEAYNKAGTILEVVGKVRVDNTFSVPAATGCGRFDGLFDDLIDKTVGLPAPAGYNTEIQNSNSKLSVAASVIASEQ